MHPTDAEAVATLIRTAFAAIPTPLDPAPSALRVTAADVLTQLETGGGAVWATDQIHGCVLWQPRPGGLYLGRLAVAPGWHGRGIATALLDTVETEARRQGQPKLLLAVRLALPGNRRLFARAGFIETVQHCHPGYTTPTYADAEKPLTAPPPETGTPRRS